ncbi:MAG: hypothetical protein AB7S26_09475 [Sandaracinaceae bacterium]
MATPHRGVWAAAIGLASLALAAGCDTDPELPDDPPLTVPGHATLREPPAPPPGMPASAIMMPGATRTDFDPPLAIPGRAEIPDPPVPQMPQMPPGGYPPGTVPPGGVPPGAVPPGGVPPGAVPPGGGAMQPMGMPVTLAPGFQPDPAIQQGIAGGSIQASTTVPPTVTCAGYIPEQPSHTVVLSDSFANFRIVVASTADTTLVVRGSDGSIRCHDDVHYPEDRNPLIEAAFAPGSYSIFVGTFSPNEQAPYTIAFTEIPAISAQTLMQAPPPG